MNNLRRDIRLTIFTIIISFLRRFSEQSFSRLQSKKRYRGNRYLRYAISNRFRTRAFGLYK